MNQHGCGILTSTKPLISVGLKRSRFFFLGGVEVPGKTLDMTFSPCCVYLAFQINLLRAGEVLIDQAEILNSIGSAEVLPFSMSVL